MVLYWIHYITLHCSALHWIALHCIAMHCIALRCISRCDGISRSAIIFVLKSSQVKSYHITSHHITSHHITIDSIGTHTNTSTHPPRVCVFRIASWPRTIPWKPPWAASPPLRSVSARYGCPARTDLQAVQHSTIQYSTVHYGAWRHKMGVTLNEIGW